MKHDFRSHAALLLGLAVLASSTFLAGCIGAADEPIDAAKHRPTVPDAGGGSVLGVISSLTGVRMSQASVTLIELDRGGEVFADGSYLFYDVPPGRYTVHVEAFAFVPASQPVTVEPGKDAYVDFVIGRAGVEAPWQELREMTGFMECSVEAGYDVHDDVEPTLEAVDIAVRERTGVDPDLRSGHGVTSGYVGQVVCGTVNVAMPNTTNDRAYHAFDLGPDIQTLVFETTWEPDTEMATNLTVRLEVQGYANQWPGTFFRKQGGPPIQTRFGPEAWAWMDAKFGEACMQGREEYCGSDFATEGFPLQSRVFPAWDCLDARAGACIVIDQPFTHYASAFYGAAGPPGWTLAPPPR